MTDPSYKRVWHELIESLLLLQDSGIDVVPVPFLLKFMNILLCADGAKPQTHEG